MVNRLRVTPERWQIRKFQAFVPLEKDLEKQKQNRTGSNSIMETLENEIKIEMVCRGKTLSS